MSASSGSLGEEGAGEVRAISTRIPAAREAAMTPLRLSARVPTVDGVWTYQGAVEAGHGERSVAEGGWAGSEMVG
jgi:hypothetical protein